MDIEEIIELMVQADGDVFQGDWVDDRAQGA